MSELTAWYALQHIYQRYTYALSAFKDVLDAPEETMEIETIGLDAPFRMGFAITAMQNIVSITKYKPAIPEYADYRNFGDELAKSFIRGLQQNHIGDRSFGKILSDDYFAAFAVLYLLGEARMQAKDFPTTAASLITEALRLENFVDAVERLGRAYHMYRVQMHDAVTKKLTEPTTVIHPPEAMDLKRHLQQPLSKLFRSMTIKQAPK